MFPLDTHKTSICLLPFYMLALKIIKHHFKKMWCLMIA